MKNNRPLLISIVAIIAIFIIGIIFVPRFFKQSPDTPTSSELDLSKYDINKFIDANEDNGYIADHVRGDLSKAKVIIFEYADYQCSGCATVTPWIAELVKEYKGDLAIIYRSCPFTSIHPSAIASASAVEAAGLQGYWEEMGDTLFANQAEWFYITGNKRTEFFANYFTSASKGAGDVEKFKSDLGSDAVKAKVAFDQAISESLKLVATPSFYGSDGTELDWASGEDSSKTTIMNFFRNYVDEQLGKK